MASPSELNMQISYCDHAPLTVEQAIDLYNRSGLGQRRPVDRPDIFAGMLAHANLTITAWHQGQIIGIARTLTDFTYVAYLADLAVDRAFQNQGIGKHLVAEMQRRLKPECMIVLLAAPSAHGYYPKLGFEHHPRAWVLRGNSET